MPISQLAGFLSLDLQQTVTDKTGLAGNYDIVLEWAPDLNQTEATQPGAAYPQPDPDGPSLQTALEDQLGLKLVSANTPADFVVIDRIEEPLPN